MEHWTTQPREPKGSEKGGQWKSNKLEAAERIYDSKYASGVINNRSVGERVYNPTLTMKLSEEESEIDRDKKRIADFISRKRKGEYTQREVIVTSVTDRAKKEIESLTKEPLNATYHTLNIDEIRHIENRHGQNGEHDKSMKDIEDYELIVDVLHDFDKVEFVKNQLGNIVYSNYTDKKGQKAPLIKFSMTMENKTKVVVEAVTDGKKRNVKIISSYYEKNKKE